MAKQKQPISIRTIWDLRAIPASKINHVCEDLRLWLHMHKQVEQLIRELGDQGVHLKISTPTEVFGWIDDGRHDCTMKLELPKEVLEAMESAQASGAVDPQVPDTGKPSTRED